MRVFAMSDEEKMPKKRGRGRPPGSKSLKPNKQGRFTTQKKKKLLELVKRNGGNVSAAAAKVGVSPATVHYHQRVDPVFKDKLELSKLEAMNDVEEAITHRGLEGVDDPVYYQGEQVGTRKVYSDTLLMERARALNPERYGRKSQVDITGNLTVEHKARTKLASLLGLELDIEDAEYEEVKSGE